MTPTNEKIARYVDAAQEALALRIEPAWRANVIEQFAILLHNADLVSSFELPDEAEPAPIYEVRRDGE